MFSEAGGSDNIHKLQAVSWHGSSLFWPASLFEKSWVCSRKNRSRSNNGRLQKVPANGISQKERFSPEQMLHRALSVRGNREDPESVWGNPWGTNLWKNLQKYLLKYPLKVCASFGEQALCPVTVWRRKTGVLLNQAGVQWSMRANAGQADKNHWAHSHLLTIAEQKWTLTVC